MRASHGRTVLGIVIAGCLLTTALAACSSDGTVRVDVPITAPKPVKTGEKVPRDATFERFTGGDGRFTDYAGKPLVINFWQTTCAPCLKEMPAFERVHQALGAKVQFVGVDVNDTLSSGKDYASKTGVTYDLVRDPRAELLSALGGVVLPTTVLVGADGTVLLVHASALSENELTSAITKAFG